MDIGLKWWEKFFLKNWGGWGRKNGRYSVEKVVLAWMVLILGSNIEQYVKKVWYHEGWERCGTESVWKKKEEEKTGKEKLTQLKMKERIHEREECNNKKNPKTKQG